MKQEARFWQAISKNMYQPQDRLDRVENGIGDGAPDVNGCIAGEDVWIELKAPIEPKRATTPLMHGNNHRLRQSQINWFARQRLAKGIAFIMVRTDKRIILVDGTQHADEFNSMTVSRLLAVAIFSCPVPTPHAEWRLLRNVIFTKSRHHRLHQHARAQDALDQLGRQSVVGDSIEGQRNPVGKRTLPAGGAGQRGFGTGTRSRRKQ